MDKSVDIIVPFYNEEGNVERTHKNNKQLEAFFTVKNYIYVNNGSCDDTQSELKSLAAKDSKIKVIEIKKNIGYGNGFKVGFLSSEADYIITNHADQQFDAHQFFSVVVDDLDFSSSVFPQRKGRALGASISTSILRATLSVILRRKLRDFNGQPKLINSSQINADISLFPDGFSFDLMLYLVTGNKQFFPVLEIKRQVGNSSWNRGWPSKFRLFKDYLKSAIRLKKLIIN